MLRPICVKCGLFFRPKKNGYGFVECIPDAKEEWRPYKLWEGDLWHCLQCGHEIIVGTGKQAIAEHHEKDFADKVKSWDATFHVNDC